MLSFYFSPSPLRAITVAIAIVERTINISKQHRKLNNHTPIETPKHKK